MNLNLNTELINNYLFQIKITRGSPNEHEYKWINLLKPPEFFNPNYHRVLDKNTLDEIDNLCNNINNINLNTIETIKTIETNKLLNISDNSENILEDNISHILHNIKTNKIYNKEQFNGVEYILTSWKNKKKIISLTGPAGSGKSYTILNMFQYFNNIFKDFKICFVAPTNNIVNKCKEIENDIKHLFKEVKFITISQLLGEKLYYDNNGKKIFKKNKYIKNIPLYLYDIIIIDESSMICDNKIQLIIEEITKQSKYILCIFVGDKNQLNPVNELENNILYNSDIHLNTNIRCSSKKLNSLFKLIIDEIELYNINYKKKNFNIFINSFINTIKNNKNNKTIFYYNNKDDFIDKFIKIYKNKNSIICNYRNEECTYLNNRIKEKIIDNENIELIDNYYINQQIIFNSRYKTDEVNFNTSEIVNVINIETNIHFNLKNINFDDIYKINKINGTTRKNFDDQLLNIDQNFKTNIQKILNKINDIPELSIIRLYITNENIKKSEKSYYINVLKSNYIQTYNNYISKLEKQIIKFKDKYNTDSQFFNDIIINTLFILLNTERIDIFANISDGYSLTCHKLQGISINNIFINLPDLLLMKDDELKNKLKIIYTSFTRCSKSIYVYY